MPVLLFIWKNYEIQIDILDPFCIFYSICVILVIVLICQFILYIGGGRVVHWCWVNFQCRGVLLVWITVGQGPYALAVGAGGGCSDIFSLAYHFFSFSLSLGDDPI